MRLPVKLFWALEIVFSQVYLTEKKDFKPKKSFCHVVLYNRLCVSVTFDNSLHLTDPLLDGAVC